MRAIKSLAVAALLAATLAAAAPMPDEIRHVSQMAAQKTNEAIVKTPGVIAGAFAKLKRTPGHMEQLRKQTRAAGRMFQPMQSATCDQAAFAEATARVLQACPSLSGLVSGATSLEEFLPGFCGSECYQTLSVELVANAACVDSTTAFLLEFVYTCQTRPQCFSEGFVSTSLRVEAQCGSQISATLDITNYTNAGLADARAFCGGSCKTDMVNLMNNYPECLGDSASEAAATVGAINQMCTMDQDEYCAVNMKVFGALQCDNSYVCATSSLCSSSCVPALTTANLNRVCGTCLSGLIPYLSAFGEDPTTMALGLQLYCMKAGTGAASDSNPYCYGPTMTAFAATSSATAASTCAATGVKACFPKMMSAVAAITVAGAQSTFAYCVNSSTSYRETCKSRLETSLVSANTVARMGDLYCAQNAANTYCYDHMNSMSVAAASCAAACAASTCPSQAVTEQAMADAGCCMPKMNAFLRTVFHAAFAGSAADVPDMIFPSGTVSVRSPRSDRSVIWTYSHTPLYARARLTRGDQPMTAMFGCAGNASSLWSIVETPCATTLASPPSSSIPVTMSWAAVSADPSQKRILEDSLSADVAATAGVSKAQVINGTLGQGTGTVQLRSSSRRQTAATGPNCKFTFSIDAADAATAEAAVAAVQTKVSSGDMLTPTTAAAAQGCTACLDARSNTLVTAAAPAPGASPPAASSASAVATAAAALVAGAMALLL